MTRKRIDPAKLKRGPIRHEELPLALISRINYLRSTLHEVHPMSMEEWLDGFRRDANPESEVRWWERLTRLYRGYSDGPAWFSICALVRERWRTSAVGTRYGQRLM